MTEERRKSPRFTVEVPVRLTARGASYPGRLRDICRDAALVEVDRPWSLETPVALAMELPGTGGPLEVLGRVVRLVPAQGGGPHGIAVLFTDVSPAAATRIDFFIALQG
jgi:hypothetical protein